MPQAVMPSDTPAPQDQDPVTTKDQADTGVYSQPKGSHPQSSLANYVSAEQQYTEKQLLKEEEKRLGGVNENVPGQTAVDQSSWSLAEIEKASNGKLPTNLVMAMLQLPTDDPDIRKLAKFTARNLDLPTAFIWKGTQYIKDHEDPLYGGPMRLTTLHRITEGLEPSVLAAMLPKMLDGQNATQVRRYLKAMMPAIDGTEVTAVQGLALAIGLIKNTVPYARFSQNLDMMSRWNSTLGRGLNGQMLLNLAAESAKEGTRITDFNDVLRYIADKSTYKPLKDLIKEADRRTAIANANVLPGPQRVEAQFRAQQPSPAPIQASQDDFMNAVDLLANKEPNTDLWAAMQDVESNLQNEQTAWQHSFVGSKFVTTMRAWNWTTEQIEKGFVDVAAPIAGVTRVLEAAVANQSGHGESIKQGDFAGAWRISMDWRNKTVAALTNHQQLGTQMVQDEGLPHWMEFPANFFFQYAADPTVIGGKLLTGARAGYALPEQLERSTLAHAVGNKVLGNIVSEFKNPFTPRLVDGTMIYRRLATKFAFGKDADKLFTALRTGDDAVFRQQMKRWGLHFAPLKGTTLAFDEPYMLRLKDAINEAVGKGMSETEARRAFGEGLLTQAGAAVPGEDSIARAVYNSRVMDSDNITAQIMNRAGDISHDGDFSDLQKVVDESAGRIPLVPEIPHTRFLGPGIREAALASRYERAARMAFGPGSQAQIAMHDPLGPQFEALARRAGLPEAEVQATAAQAARLSGAGFEQAAQSLADDVLSNALKRRLLSRGVDSAEVKKYMDYITNHMFGGGGRNKPVFGILSQGKSTEHIENVMLPTQALNFYAHADPVDLLNIADRMTGHVADLRNSLLKNGSKISLPEAFQLLESTDQGFRTALRTWKFLAVPRPGYTWRVVGFAEQARWLAAVGAFFDKGASTNLRAASETIARSFTPLPSVPVLGRALTEHVIAPIGEAGGWVVDNTIGRMLDFLYPGVRPGRFPDMDFANTAWRETEVADDAIRRASFSSRLMKSGYGEVVPGAKNYYEQWSHVLVNQWAQSDIGQDMLRSILDGDNAERAIGKALDWANNNKQLMRTMGYNPAEFSAWAEKLWKLTKSYTLENGDIAAQALGSRDTGAMEGVLKAIDGDVTLPSVHGPVVEQYLGTAPGMIQKYVDYWYDVFVRQPHNIINRQPFYKRWYQTYGRALEKHYTEMGGGELSPTTRSLIDEQANKLALGQLKKVLFDYSDRGKWAENLSLVFPFIQPFVKEFTTWGYILAHRNPALVGVARSLWQAGTQSGFVHQDALTGEYVIPSSWFATNTVGTQMLANALNAKDHTGAFIHINKAFTPLAALNLFFASTMEVPRSGLLGHIAGGAEIPVPGMNPAATFLLQKVFKNSNNDFVQSYLFKYGYSTPFLPASMERILQGVFPQWFNDDTQQGVKITTTRQLEARGIIKQWETELAQKGMSGPDIATEVDRRVTAMARNLTIATGWAGLYQFGQTQRYGEEYDLEVELKNDRDQLGLEDGTTKFLQAHPDDALFTVGKLHFGPQDKDLQGNTILDASGKPYLEGVSTPLAPVTQELINNPNFKDIAHTYPELFGALLLNLDNKLTDQYSYPVLSAMIQRGWYQSKSFEDAMAQAEGSGPKGFWSAIQQIKTHDNYDKYSQSDPQYDILKERYHQDLIPLMQQYPFEAQRYLTAVDPENPDAGLTFRGNDEGGPPVGEVAKIYSFANIPELQGFPSVQGLKAYLDGRDKIKAEMAHQGVSSLSEVSAEHLGLPGQMQKLQDQIKQAYPEAWVVIDKMLPNDLYWSGAVENGVDSKLRTWQQADDPRVGEFWAFRKQYYRLYSDNTNPDYDGIRSLVNETMAKKPWLMKMVWNQQPYYLREERRQRLLTLEPLYYTRWDWHLMGQDMTTRAAQWLGDLEQHQNQIFAAYAEAKAKGQPYDVQGAFNEMDAITRGLKKRDKSFRDTINEINIWGFQLKAYGLLDRPGNEGKAWKSLYAHAQDAQNFVENNNLTSYDDGYKQHKEWITQSVEWWDTNNTAFHNALDDSGLSPTELSDILMPPAASGGGWFGPLGGK